MDGSKISNGTRALVLVYEYGIYGISYLVVYIIIGYEYIEYIAVLSQPWIRSPPGGPRDANHGPRTRELHHAYTGGVFDPRPYLRLLRSRGPWVRLQILQDEKKRAEADYEKLKKKYDNKIRKRNERV